VAIALLFALAPPVSAQLPPADAFAIGAGGDVGAAEVGMPSNPAALAGARGWAGALLPLHLALGLGPITGRDLAGAGDGSVSRRTRERWLARVGAEGQRGRIEGAVTPVALRRGTVALQVTSSLVGRTRLPRDAVELLLFGNAGLGGSAADLRLDGSALDGALFTTASLAWGTALTPQLSLGVRGHATIGHGVLVTRDDGSVLDGGSAGGALRLPTLSSVGTAPGWGFGLDVGVGWKGGRSTTGVALVNAASTFRWAASELRFREGETLLEGEGVETDFEARPAEDAPPALRALLGRLTPATRIEAEHIREVGAGARVRFAVRERLERGVSPGRPDVILVGVERDGVGPLDLAAHAGSSDGAFRLGAGLRAGIGAWSLGGAWILERGGPRDGSTYALSLSWRAG
jgi:hypothetical protein